MKLVLDVPEFGLEEVVHRVVVDQHEDLLGALHVVKRLASRGKDDCHDAGGFLKIIDDLPFFAIRH